MLSFAVKKQFLYAFAAASVVGIHLTEEGAVNAKVIKFFFPRITLIT